MQGFVRGQERSPSNFSGVGNTIQERGFVRDKALGVSAIRVLVQAEWWQVTTVELTAIWHRFKHNFCSLLGTRLS